MATVEQADRTQPALFLEPLYLNQRRVTNLVGGEHVAAVVGRGSSIPSRPGFEKAEQYALQAMYARMLADWLSAQNGSIRSFESLWVQRKAQVGTIFTAHRDFYCRNVRRLKPTTSPPRALAKYPGLAPGDRELQLHLLLNLEHVSPGSPGNHLHGRVADLFVVAQITDATDQAIEAVPIFIGHRLSGPTAFMNGISSFSCEVHVDQIDSFETVTNVRPGARTDLEILRTIPELDVKGAFAEIVGEPIVPKDWAGETSDLFTTHLQLGGRRVSTAFMFKGPARFHPMKVADLGKNGDQIQRLFREPADLIVVQHCHQIDPTVRWLLRSLCNQVGSSKNCCAIDGTDTLRILRAYRKCGLSPRVRRATQ